MKYWFKVVAKTSLYFLQVHHKNELRIPLILQFRRSSNVHFSSRPSHIRFPEPRLSPMLQSLSLPTTNSPSSLDPALCSYRPSKPVNTPSFLFLTLLPLSLTPITNNVRRFLGRLHLRCGRHHYRQPAGPHKNTSASGQDRTATCSRSYHYGNRRRGYSSHSHCRSPAPAPDATRLQSAI